ncbi:hypothetical protein LEP1GSC175_2534 [Leptospira santarosai str. HAI821]|uniref:Uncharacterized protein n=1 Tax=Leptospira santarosai str. ZUN179 TaxID=1049985 RepID=M6UYB2_9LEPT|nr:hypothetical protein LEP1GSC175_2534 [Leptospira santarosai str. HAI821]EMO45989.1 hypothetical protein LEP1GSC187_3677 [Leptospira santarosai str. ZUN179]KXZ25327.1 hypothetical protein AYB33_09460 [Leptospira santarosai]
MKISLPTVFIRKFQAIYADTDNSNPFPSSYFCDQKPGPIAKIFHRFSFVARPKTSALFRVLIHSLLVLWE